MAATIHRLHPTNPIAGGPPRPQMADMLVDSVNRTRSEVPLFRGNTNSLIILGRGA